MGHLARYAVPLLQKLMIRARSLLENELQVVTKKPDRPYIAEFEDPKFEDLPVTSSQIYIYIL